MLINNKIYREYKKVINNLKDFINVLERNILKVLIFVKIWYNNIRKYWQIEVYRLLLKGAKGMARISYQSRIGNYNKT